MAVLIDADVLIEAERGTFDLFAWLESQPEEQFFLAAITVAELWQGVERATGSHRAKREQFLERVFATFEVVPYSGSTSFVHAGLWAHLETAGRLIGPHDMILAATAQERGDAVATFNARHFAAIPGLKVLAPS